MGVTQKSKLPQRSHFKELTCPQVIYEKMIYFAILTFPTKFHKNQPAFCKEERPSAVMSEEKGLPFAGYTKTKFLQLKDTKNNGINNH